MNAPFEEIEPAPERLLPPEAGLNNEKGGKI